MFGADTWDLFLLWKNADDTIIDVTDWNARLRMYPDKYVDRAPPIVELTKGGGITLSDGSSGANIVCQITDENSDFDSNPPGYLILELEDTLGQWQRLLEGKLKYSKASLLIPAP